jgi:antitoxin HicB
MQQMTQWHWNYGVDIAREGADFVVSVRDLPEVVTSGDTREQALDLAADAIDAIVAHRVEKNLDLPKPTPLAPDEISVALPAQSAAKASVYSAWREAHISKTELAARLDVAENQARRILDLRHASSLATLDRAARAMGYRLIVAAEKIA